MMLFAARRMPPWLPERATVVRSVFRPASLSTSTRVITSMIVPLRAAAPLARPPVEPTMVDWSSCGLFTVLVAVATMSRAVTREPSPKLATARWVTTLSATAPEPASAP